MGLRAQQMYCIRLQNPTAQPSFLAEGAEARQVPKLLVLLEGVNDAEYRCDDGTNLYTGRRHQLLKVHPAALGLATHVRSNFAGSTSRGF